MESKIPGTQPTSPNRSVLDFKIVTIAENKIIKIKIKSCHNLSQSNSSEKTYRRCGQESGEFVAGQFPPKCHHAVNNAIAKKIHVFVEDNHLGMILLECKQKETNVQN